MKILSLILTLVVLFSCTTRTIKTNDVHDSIHNDSNHIFQKDINEFDTLNVLCKSGDSEINIKDLRDFRLLANIDTSKLYSKYFVQIDTIFNSKLSDYKKYLLNKISYDTIFKIIMRFQDSIHIPKTDLYIFDLMDDFDGVASYHVLSLWKKNFNKFQFLSYLNNKIWYLTFGNISIDKFIKLNDKNYLIIGETNGGDAWSYSGSIFWGLMTLPDKLKLDKEVFYGMQADYYGVGTGTLMKYEYNDSTNELIIRNYKRTINDSINFDELVLLKTFKYRLRK